MKTPDYGSTDQVLILGALELNVGAEEYVPPFGAIGSIPVAEVTLGGSGSKTDTERMSWKAPD
ncbi:MAG: hypothetical protein AAB834_03740, partial [Patescibacteria group bacterium]